MQFRHDFKEGSNQALTDYPPPFHPQDFVDPGVPEVPFQSTVR